MATYAPNLTIAASTRRMLHEIERSPDEHTILHSDQNTKIMEATIPPYLLFTDDPQRDPVYDHLKSLLPIKFDIPAVAQSPGGIALFSLCKHGLEDHLTVETRRNLSLVSKIFWNTFGSQLEVAFRPLEAWPRVNNSAFDDFYFATKSGKIHRLTLIFAPDLHINNIDAFACFVDSELIFVSSIRNFTLHTLGVIFHSDNVSNFLMPKKIKKTFLKCGFVVDGTPIEIHSLSNPKHVSRFSRGYYPNTYYVFINGRCTKTGETIKEHYKRWLVPKLKNVCSTITCAFSWFCCPLWLIFLCFFDLCTRRFVQKKCRVRKYCLYTGARKHITLKKRFLKRIAKKYAPTNMV